jgi:hypothetical protein
VADLLSLSGKLNQFCQTYKLIIPDAFAVDWGELVLNHLWP